MPGEFAKILRLSMRDRVFLAEATVHLGLAALAVAVLPFRSLAGIASLMPRTSQASSADVSVLVDKVRWAVQAASRRVPWRAKCFEQGLTAQHMLRRRGVPSVLYYGAAPKGPAEMAAHVWVRAGEFDVVGCEIASQFALLAKFPDPDELRVAAP